MLGFEKNLRYQSRVNPASGKLTSPSLNENTARITIGAYRNTTSSEKNRVRPRLVFGEVAMSLTAPPPAS